MKVSEIKRRMKAIDKLAVDLEDAVNELRQQLRDDGDNAEVLVYSSGGGDTDDYFSNTVSTKYTQTF